MGGPAPLRRVAGGAVDVENVGELAGDQADVGLGPVPPPPRELLPQGRYRTLDGQDHSAFRTASDTGAGPVTEFLKR